MKTILLLHGAIGASDQLIPLQKKLEKDFEVYTLNFSGHGGTPFNEKGFSIEIFADEVLAFIDGKGLESVNIFGYSMGGYVALYLAKNHRNRVAKIMTLATKFHWDEATAAKEVAMLDADKIIAKLPAFADTLAKRHESNDWKEVLDKTKDMLLVMGNKNPLNIEDYASIDLPVTVLLGDRDRMVGIEETIAIYKALPNAQMGMLPNTHHPIEQVDTDMLAFMIQQLMK